MSRRGLERRTGAQVRAAKPSARRRPCPDRADRGPWREGRTDARGSHRRSEGRYVGCHVRGRLADAAERRARSQRRRGSDVELEAARRGRVCGRPVRARGRAATLPRRPRHAAAGAGRPLDGAAARFGGNIDCKELVAGTRLLLPIPVDGALFSAGDGHARQGDGEVSQTAIECPLDRLELTLEVRDEPSLETPAAWTPDAWLTFGFDEDLDRAASIATDAMLKLMVREHGLERRDALALASVVVDLRVTQIVNGVRGVHALLPHDAIRMP